MIPPAAANAARTWQPGIAIRLSFWLHIACVAAAIMRHQWWPWALAIIVANHFILALIGLWPKSGSLGANMVRLPDAAVRRGEVVLTFDDGPDPQVTPKVLDLLDRYQAKASFFCVGEKVAAHPDVIREIVRRGHSVENHSLRHSGFFGFLGFGSLRKDIGTAQQTIAAVTGRPPAFFRSPMGIRNPMLDPVMARLGLNYITWTRRGFDTVTRSPQAVLRRLTSGLAAGDILLLHDRRTGPADPPVLEVLPLLLQNIAAAGLKPVSLPMAMR